MHEGDEPFSIWPDEGTPGGHLSFGLGKVVQMLTSHANELLSSLFMIGIYQILFGYVTQGNVEI